MKKITTIFLAVVALLTSCEKSQIELDNPQVEAGEAIELSLGALTVEQMGAGTAEAAQQQQGETIPLTKSRLSTEPSTEIKNLWVMQFSHNGKIVGIPYYFENFDKLADEDKKVKLIPSGAAGEEGKNTIVYLANTFNDQLIQFVGNNYSIDDVATLSRSIKNEESNFVTSDDASDTKKYMVMYGSISQHIISGETLQTCTLKRTVAKISVTLVNNVKNNGLIFNNVEIVGIPNESYYYPTLTENHPADGTFHTIDYPKEDIIEKNIIKGTTNFTFYVPTNRRGTVLNTSQHYKNHFGTHTSTSINITAKDDSGETYFYTFYLGANLTDDFNIDCNKEYKYTLTFDSKGDPTTDLRVTVLSNTDFTPNTTPRSNCYILNPSDITDQKIYIPIDRIDKFWKKENGYITDGDIYVNNTLSDVNGQWEAVLMWHDSEYTLEGVGEDQNLGGLKVARGTSPSTHEPCVVVTLPQHYENCNVGYVVRRTDEQNKGVVLWSWHLWITDYNPYPKMLSPSLNIWSYEVDGGQLHRYNNPAFVGGIYSDKFIMDRNLGARSADFEGHGSANPTKNAGSLYYQFGRKDPFTGVTTKYLNGYGYDTDGDGAKQQSFEYSVNHPDKFIIYEGNWCKSANSKILSYIWNDHNINEKGYNTGKSIFDPSPLGFRLPIADTWSKFTGGNQETESASPDDYTFVWTRHLNPILVKYDYGRLYNGYAYYPASGFVKPDNGANSHAGSNGYSWSANLSSEKCGYSLSFGAPFLSIKRPDDVRAKGYPVRPIQE